MNSTNKRLYLTAMQEEQHLLQSARGGNAEAFEKLVKPHWNALLRVAQRILRNREDAEDTIQTALLNAWLNLDAFQGRSRFSSWLTRIAINSALMQLRAIRYRKNEVPLDEMVQPDSPIGFSVVEARSNPEHDFSAKEILQLIESAFHRLGLHYADVLEMSVVQELTVKEAARILDVPVATVKSRLYRARGILSRSVQAKIGLRRQHVNVAAVRTAGLAPRTAYGT